VRICRCNEAKAVTAPYDCAAILIMDEMGTPGEGTRPTSGRLCGGCRPGALTRRGGDRAIMRIADDCGVAVDFPQERSQTSIMKYRVVIEPDEDGVFVAECPALPGCISQGMTRTEALANIKDAMTGYLASLKKHGEPVPPPISEEIVEIQA